MKKVLLGKRRKRVTLKRRSHRGGEGEICRVVELPKSVVKLLDNPTVDLEDKVRWMSTNRPPLSEFVSASFPRKLVFNVEGDFVGYEMQWAAAKRTVYSLFQPDTRPPGLTETWLLTLAKNICVALSDIHAAGHRFPDFSFTNVLAGRRATVHLVDTDSMYLYTPNRVFRSEACMPEFRPPEGFSRQDDRLVESDWWGLAVLNSFLLLNSHPFRCKFVGGRGQKPLKLEEKIKRGIYPHAREPRDKDYRAPDNGARFEQLPVEFQELFRRCFEDGHLELAKRPSPDEWKDAFEGALATEAGIFGARIKPIPKDAWREARQKAVGRRQPRPRAVRRRRWDFWRPVRVGW